MLDKLKEMSRRLGEHSPSFMERKVLEILKEEEAGILDLNIGQMMAGKNADGSTIFPEYTERTKRIKQAKGQPSDRVTLRDEGDFHQGMIMEADNFPVMLTSQDDKTGMLVEKYGNEIFGLNKKNLRTVAREDVLPRLQNYLRAVLHI